MKSKPGPKIGFRGTEEQRFWDKVKVNYVTGCWEWQAALVSGYGRFKPAGSRRMMQAHTWAYEYIIGPIVAPLEPDHLCRVRSCVNPWHIEPVTRLVNLLRGETIIARNAARTECNYGHPMTGENVMINSDGSTRCRICYQKSKSESGKRAYYRTRKVKRPRKFPNGSIAKRK